jgi:hypothetical protein
MGGGIAGYGAAYVTIGVIALVLTGLALGLKTRSQELATVAAFSVSNQPVFANQTETR